MRATVKVRCNGDLTNSKEGKCECRAEGGYSRQEHWVLLSEMGIVRGCHEPQSDQVLFSRCVTRQLFFY